MAPPKTTAWRKIVVGVPFIVLLIVSICVPLDTDDLPASGSSPSVDPPSRESLEQEYLSLLGLLSTEKPGRGLLDYPGNPTGDYAKSYAMILSAELMRASAEQPFALSTIANNSGIWLLENADIDNDGVVGWGLPVEWDAYGDGSINPANTIYTITTAIAINALLDWMEQDPQAPTERLLNTVSLAFQPFLDPDNRSLNDILTYSLSYNDRVYETFNPAAYMAGQLQRYTVLFPEDPQREQMREVADGVMMALLLNKQVDNAGGWYWSYDFDGQGLNDLTHALYIMDGIRQYIENGGRYAAEFDWFAINNHLNSFYENGQLRQFPNFIPASSNSTLRLYNIGMYLYWLGRFGDINTGLRVSSYLPDYKLPDGSYTRYPIGSGEPPLAVNEYMAYLLYGLSHFLYTPPGMVAKTQQQLEMIFLPSTNLSEPVRVPFTDFNTPHHAISFEFDIESLQGGFILDGNEPLPLPPNTIPMKVVETADTILIIFTRDLWEGRIRCWMLDLTSGDYHEIPIPEGIAFGLFRQAVRYQSSIVLVIFDPVAKTNYFYRIWLSGQDEPVATFDETSRHEFFIDERYAYRQQPHILTMEVQESLFFCSDSTIYRYRHESDNSNSINIQEYHLPSNYRVLEIATDGTQAIGLYKDIDYDPGNADIQASQQFRLYDYINQEFLDYDFIEAIPYHLQMRNGEPVLSYVSNSNDLNELFLLDMKNMNASGMMSAGLNNYEGEVIWSQSYYLNGFIDLLSVDADPTRSFTLGALTPEIKLRLDIEMALIDRMMSEGPGLLCKNFTVDRSSVLHAVQTGKLLLLMKRYKSEVPNPIQLNSYAAFKQQVFSLDNHIEILVQAGEDDPWLENGRYFLMWPKGANFWADGVGIPYNHQNVWAAAVLYDEDPANLDPEVLMAARDIALQVVDYEGFRAQLPKHAETNSGADDYFEWAYWWGQAKVGWDESDGISINTPSWEGDGDNTALPVYRTFDAIAMLLLEDQFPGELPSGMVKYLRLAVENDSLELFLAPYLTMHNESPSITWSLAAKYLRFQSQPDLRDAVWAYRALQKQLPVNDLAYLILPAEQTPASELAHIVVFAADVFVVALSALLAASLFRMRSFSGWILAWYLCGYAIIVLTVEIAGTVSLLNQKSFFLLVHACIGLSLWIVWLLMNNPPLIEPPRKLYLFIRKHVMTKTGLRKNWDVFSLAIIAIIGYLFLGYSNLVMPQTIDDVLTAYLARTGYWLQHGNLLPWPADTYQLYQIIYPINAQAQIYWSLLFLRTDQLSGLSQWISLPVLMASVYGLTRLLGSNRRWSVFAALVAFGLPAVHLQALTALTDLISVTLVSVTIFLFLLGGSRNDYGALILSGISLGLAAGTKQTVVFAFPGILFMILLFLGKDMRARLRPAIIWGLAALTSFTLLGAYAYGVNLANWGSPTGPADVIQGFTQRTEPLTILDMISRFLGNTGRLFGAIFKMDLYSWDYPGVAWYGPALVFIFIFVSLYMFVVFKKRAINTGALALLVISVSEAMVLLWVRDYTPALARYLILPIILLIPIAVSGIKQFYDEPGN